MGWCYANEEGPRKAFIAERLEGWDTDGATAKLLAHADHGSRLWKVYEFTYKQGERAGQTERFIALDLIAKWRGHGWGYKDMEETMGPCYYDCPLRFLEMVPAPEGEFVQEWRARVREYWAAKAKVKAKIRSLKIGDVLSLVPGCTPQQVTIVSLKPLRGRGPQGGIYKLAPRFIAA